MRIITTLSLLLLPVAAMAGSSGQVPEPGIFALLGIGLVGLLITRFRKK